MDFDRLKAIVLRVEAELRIGITDHRETKPEIP
jgi:hypothetical protein